MLDEDGVVVQLLDYYPYGSTRLDEKWGAFDEKRKFTGHELDDETGLYYANARYYSPDLGRFASLDPAALNSPQKFLTDPQQLNFYAYARNNPVKYVDLSGCDIWDRYAGFFNGIYEGGAGTVSFIGQAITHPIDTTSNVVGNFADNASYLYNYAQNHTASQFVSDVDEGVGIHVDTFNKMSDHEKGQIIGQVTEKLAEIAIGAKALKSGKSLSNSSSRSINFSPGKIGNSLENARQHFIKHGSDFSYIKNEFEYAQQVDIFTKSPPSGSLIKNLSNGRRAVYDVKTNTLGFTENNAPTSMYKPNLSVHGFETNLDYFRSLK